MKSALTNVLMAPGLIAIGAGIATAGIYTGETDEAPGAVVLGVRMARRKV